MQIMLFFCEKWILQL